MSKGQYKIPLWKDHHLYLDGSLCGYPESYYEKNGQINWVENFEFKDQLQYGGFTRGRSSAKIHWISAKSGKKYEMFLKDMDDVLRKCVIVNGFVDATWTFCKRGKNYGIKLV